MGVRRIASFFNKSNEGSENDSDLAYCGTLSPPFLLFKNQSVISAACPP
jgi:hypothetical protein